MSSSSSASDSIHYSHQEINQVLYDAYTDPAYGKATPTQFWARLKNIPDFIHTYKLQYKQVLDFVKNIPEYQKTKKPIGKPKSYFPIQSPNGPFSKMSMDLMDLRQFHVPGEVYLLIVLDVATRYVAAAFTKTKSTDEILEKLEDCFRDIKSVNGYLPSTFRLMGDQESAWAASGQAKHFFAENEIHTYFINHDKFQTSMVERFIRSLRDKLNGYASIHAHPNWKEVIPDLIEEYNEDLKHSTLHQTPLEAVNKGPNWRQLRDTRRKIEAAKRSYNKLGYKSKYKIGDLVRVELKKNTIFRQKGGRQFVSEPARIIGKFGNRYRVQGYPEDIFSTSELLPYRESTLDVRRKHPYEESDQKEEESKFKRIQSQFKRKDKEGLDQLPSFTSIPRSQRARKPTDYGPVINFQR